MSFDVILNRKDKTIVQVFEDGSQVAKGRYYTPDDLSDEGLLNYETISEAYYLWSQKHKEVIKDLGEDSIPKMHPEKLESLSPTYQKRAKCSVQDVLFVTFI